MSNETTTGVDPIDGFPAGDIAKPVAKARHKPKAVKPALDAESILDRLESETDDRSIVAREIIEDLAKEAIDDATESQSNGTGKAPALTADQFESLKGKSVSTIVDMIGKGISSASEQAYAVGREAYGLAVQWRTYQTGYNNTHFNAMVDEIRSKCLIRFSVKAESIQVAVWIRAYRLRELVRELIDDNGKLADSINMHEAKALIGKSLYFDVKSLDSRIHASWFKFFQELAIDRAADHNSTIGEAFTERIKDYVQTLADAETAGMDADKLATIKAAREINEKKEKTQKAVDKIGSAIEEALKTGTVNPSAAFGILETKVKESGEALPPIVGFDPATCTASDCVILATAMLNAGKIDEMKVLRRELDKRISYIEREKAKHDAIVDVRTATLNPHANSVAVPA